MKVKEIISWIDGIAPFSYQESYDNSGLQTGNPETEVKGSLVCIDVTEEVIDEALRLDANLIISHHPVIFGGLKTITGKTFPERIIIKALKKDIAIISVHTNLDRSFHGVSRRMAEKLGLINLKVLDPVKDSLVKLVFFVPPDHLEKVREGIFEAGAGVIGEYDMCSFNLKGTGTFRGSQNTNPFVGQKGELHTEKEMRVETILPSYLQNNILQALLKSHPYEEVAYDIYPLKNEFSRAGMGMIGDIDPARDEQDFLDFVKEVFLSKCIRHTALLNRKISRVAVCGGSGSTLIGKAICAGADIFITGDIKYHQFFEAENRILVADIGHYESEQFTKEIIYESLTEKFPKFAVHLSEVNTNPINYL